MNLLLFASGIILFLYAMSRMEQALSEIGSHSLKQALQKQTRSPIQGILIGTVSTAILQSSSVVGLITLAFVAAAIIPFRNAIGIMLGSNLGTTFTGWVVTIIGFKLNLAEFSFPILAFGAFLILLGNKNRNTTNIGAAIFSFGLLLIGLSLMKDSIHFITEYIDIVNLKDMPLVVFFLLGALLTAIIQSSSATMLITLAALNAQLIQLPAAAALIIGADLGTTSTVMIGAFQGAITKKQVAFVHFIFNLVTDVLALSSIHWLLQLVTDFYGLEDPLFSLVALHSSFNFIGIFIFLPLLSQLEKLTYRVFPPPKEITLAIENIKPNVTDAAIKAVESDTNTLLNQSVDLNSIRLSIPAVNHSQTQAKHGSTETTTHYYNRLKRTETLLTDYLLELQRQSLSHENAERIVQLLVVIRNTIYATKSIKDIHKDLLDFRSLGHRVNQNLNTVIATTANCYIYVLSWLNGSKDFTIESLNNALIDLSNAHSQFNQVIYSLIEQHQLTQENASTAFNINRELLLSGHSLLNAIEHLLLPSEKSKTLSELLKIER